MTMNPHGELPSHSLLAASPLYAAPPAFGARHAATVWPAASRAVTPRPASSTSTLPSLSPSAGPCWSDTSPLPATSATKAATRTRLPSPAALLSSVSRQACAAGGGGKAAWVRDRRMDVASLLSPVASPLAHGRAMATTGRTPVVPWIAADGYSRYENILSGTPPPTDVPTPTPATIFAPVVDASLPPPASSTRTRCTVCPKVLSSRTNMLRHVRVVHERSQVLRCDRCPSAFLYACQLKLHTATVHQKRRPFPCPVCGRGFGTRGHAKEHLQLVHQKRRPFGCGRCDKRCRTRALLAAHTRTAHGEREAAGGADGAAVPVPPPPPPPSAWEVGGVEAGAGRGEGTAWTPAAALYGAELQAPISSQ